MSLDVASTVLIKDPESEGYEPPSRSRCRRLYDIANVLVALGLIRKVHYLFGTKKIPLFVYCGPELAPGNQPEGTPAHSARPKLEELEDEWEADKENRPPEAVVGRPAVSISTHQHQPMAGRGPVKRHLAPIHSADEPSPSTGPKRLKMESPLAASLPRPLPQKPAQTSSMPPLGLPLTATVQPMSYKSAPAVPSASWLSSLGPIWAQIQSSAQTQGSLATSTLVSLGQRSASDGGVCSSGDGKENAKPAMRHSVMSILGVSQRG